MSHPLPSAQNIPLTPLQQGMYFTWLQDPAAGIDIEQMVCTLPEAIDAPRLRTAWETLTATHDILKVAVAATSPEAGDFASTQSSRLVRLPGEPNLRHSLDADLPHAEVGDVVPDKKPHIVCQGCLPDGHEDHEGQRLG